MIMTFGNWRCEATWAPQLNKHGKSVIQCMRVYRNEIGFSLSFGCWRKEKRREKNKTKWKQHVFLLNIKTQMTHVFTENDKKKSAENKNVLSSFNWKLKRMLISYVVGKQSATATTGCIQIRCFNTTDFVNFLALAKANYDSVQANIWVCNLMKISLYMSQSMRAHTRMSKWAKPNTVNDDMTKKWNEMKWKMIRNNFLIKASTCIAFLRHSRNEHIRLKCV